MRICVNSNTFKLQGLLITGWPPNDMGNGSLRVSKRSKFSPVSNNKFNAVPYQHRRVRSSFTTAAAAAGDAIKIVHHGIRNPPPVPLHSSEGRIFSDGIASHCTATASGGNGVGGLVVPFRQRAAVTSEAAPPAALRRQRHKFRHQHCRSLQYKTFLPRFKFE